ncbi:MAG: hypothetical protein WAU70_11555 [Flavobacteriales bacterium]
MNRILAAAVAVLGAVCLYAQGGDAAQRAQAEALFAQGRFADAMPMYSQLVSLNAADRDLNYRLGTCMIHSGGDKEKAVGFLKFATQDPGITPLAFFYLGRALHVTYGFTEALAAYAKFEEKADKKSLSEHPVEVLEKQCRNGLQLLSNLKEIEVHSKVEVDGTQFDRFYDLTDMGGRIVEVPDELKTSLDRKDGRRSLIFKPDKGGTIYFSSYGKDGRTGRDIYTTELLPSGTFAEPRKLAGYVNTDQDEDFAYMHPDGKTFYFSSKGHNSMGGYDVFRTNYDRGLDVFGTPENLDFAVNTPDDDLLYIVDPGGKEACFASARDSRQGSIHVYRVSTAQMPLDLVILKGQYLSEIDGTDRKAHIIVEDATTRKQVADVRTGLDGTYVLSLPHSGRYKFMVEAGPGGRTHVGMVEAPRVDAARAYRQELVLQNLGGQEKLLIKNYFNEPLADDLVALALEEIKRRAKLDVTQAAPVAEKPAAEEKPVGDVMTQAGFAGNVSVTDAMKLAQDDAKELGALADDLEEQSGAAFTAALQAASDAEKATGAAAQHIRNADAATDAAVKNAEMTEAARERERARTANLRAKAALRAGQDLEVEAMAVTQQAVKADKLSTDLTAAVNNKNDATSVQQLTVLKDRLAAKNGPDATVAVHERTRRAAVEKEREASRALQAASTQRDEEGELVTRIGRLERERDETKSKSRKEDLNKEIASYQDQLSALRDETARAFAKAKGMEGETALMRSQASLMKVLDDGSGPLVATELNATQVNELGRRLASSEQSTAALPIDERFEAAIAEEVARQRTIANDWSLSGDAIASNGVAGNTQTIERPADGTERLNTTQTEMQRDALAQETTGDRNTTAGTVPNGVPDGTSAMTTTQTQAQRDALAQQPNGRLTGPGNAPVKEGGNGASGATAVKDTSGRVVVPSDSLMPSTPDPGNTLVSSPDRAQERFVMENELAELEQLRASEKNKTERARLDMRIAELRQRMARATEVAVPEATMEEPVVMTDDTPTIARPATAFDRNMPDGELIGLLFTNYAADHERSIKLTDPVERANAAHGLELMLVDSLQAEADRQTTVLESAPERADEILPRVERLRQMRLAHTAEADRYLKEAGIANEALARNIDPAEDYAIDPGNGTTKQGNPPQRSSSTSTSHVDEYISPVDDPEFILESPIDFRSTKVADALLIREQDMERMVDMEEEIDSLETVLEEMPRGKEYDKVRKRADRLIDDRVIQRTEMGARSAFLTKQEYEHANDSLKQVRGDVNRMGLAPDEPLVQMARQMEEDARTQFTQAQQVRKLADRAEDIVVRDSLFRAAFGMEVMSLRGLDQALTVNNYLLSTDFARGQTMTYTAIERKMFGGEEPPLAEQKPIKGSTTPEVAASDTLAENADGSVAEQLHKVDGTTEQAQPEVTQEIKSSPTGGSTDANPLTGQAGTSGTTGTTNPSNSQVAAPGSVPADRAVQTGERPVWNSLGAQEFAVAATEALEDARMLERGSVEQADAAMALRDSADKAKRRDRETLEQQAVLAQQRSDEMHARSLIAAAKSDSLLVLQHEAEQDQLLSDRLRQFYYLTNDEATSVMGQTDHSRYFEARSLALDQRQRSDVARMDAIGSRQLAQALVDQSKAVLANATGAQGANTEEMAQATALNDRAVQLNGRADSLDAVAARLDGSANVNESQAAALLQGLPPERSTAIMALEQRTRRTEPMLAEARSTVQQPPAESTGNGTVADVPPPGTDASGVNKRPEPISQPVVQPSSPTGSQGHEDPVPTTAPTTAAGIGDRPLLPPLEADVFTLLPAGERTARAIPLDGAMPAGLVYKVQIGAFRFPIPEDLFSDMTPVTGEVVGNGMVRYMAGMFTNYSNADNAKEQVRDRGYRDAFVVAYLNGQRISLGEARNLQGGIASAQEERTQPATTIPVTNTVTAQRPTVPDAAPITLNTVPIASTLAAAPEDEATVLAKYPATADQVLATFTPATNATEYYNVPGAAPAKQVEMIKGLFFTVQVGVYSKPVALEKLFNITPLNSERTETAKVRYTTGVYLDTEKARVRKDATVALGVKDAFVTAYLNGKRIPIRDARALLTRFGNSVLADPALATP